MAPTPSLLDLAGFAVWRIELAIAGECVSLENA
jgi:hypothetical protein